MREKVQYLDYFSNAIQNIEKLMHHENQGLAWGHSGDPAHPGSSRRCDWIKQVLSTAYKSAGEVSSST
jgi:predicted urease superfamily metal-dependent hydrolase